MTVKKTIPTYDSKHRLTGSISIAGKKAPIVKKKPTPITLVETTLEERALEAPFQRARPNDLLAIWRLEHETYTEIEPWGKEEFMAYLTNLRYNFQVLYDGKVLMAYGCAGVTKGIREIDTLTVNEGYRGLGLGSKMLDHLLAWLAKKDITEVKLEVEPENHMAQALYRRKGFKEVKRLVDYYAPGKDAILMSKKFKRK